jgi:hypothetical protein
MNKTLKKMLGMALAVVALAILIRAFRETRGNPPDQDDEDKQAAIKTPVRVSIQNGETILTLDQQTQSNMGITVAPLEAASTRQQQVAPAVVLPVQELVSTRSDYVAAQNKLKKTQINAEVSGKEYERLKTLYANNQNASEKALESAEGAFRSDQTDVEAARQGLELQLATVRQAWGSVVVNWIADDAPALERVFDQKEQLVQVILPSTGTSSAPATTPLEIPGGKFTQARLVSPFPRVDPRVQGATFLYVAPAQPGLAPGLNLLARLPVGRLMHGVVVPESAIVWWEGQAWMYQQTAPDHFARRAVPTDDPVKNGFLVEKGLAPANRIVVKGAQTLLSEEFRSQIQAQD